MAVIYLSNEGMRRHNFFNIWDVKFSAGINRLILLDAVTHCLQITVLPSWKNYWKTKYSFETCLLYYLYLDAILHSYHQEYPWTSNENKGFNQALASNFSAGNFNFSTEYLDTKRVTFSNEYQEFFFNYLKQKYICYSPDVIFCSDDNALAFLLKFKERLFGDTPVVFCGVNNLDVEESFKSRAICWRFWKERNCPQSSPTQNIQSPSWKYYYFRR